MHPLLPDLPPLAFHSVLTNSLSLLFFFLVFSPFLVNFAAYEQPHCLTEIQSLTFNPTPGCASLAKEMFAMKTKATLALWCPGYSETQINATQAMKKRRKRKVTTNKCLEQVSQLLGLWRRFIRTLLKKQ
ncbi:hypothetical protein H8958_011075 [Nasalis larvatus]|uniref:thymic stromal lymphopoietin isoform X1 n=1 Tax=Rhinopithecus bieti TaxID=61621 RepID=UPI0005336AA9|nr:PREDICTED: thymic stromal lymphopoietin isoform X1 [Rhinopithecus bieti]